MTSSQETERVYSYNPVAHTGQLAWSTQAHTNTDIHTQRHRQRQLDRQFSPHCSRKAASGWGCARSVSLDADYSDGVDCCKSLTNSSESLSASKRLAPNWSDLTLYQQVDIVEQLVDSVFKKLSANKPFYENKGLLEDNFLKQNLSTDSLSYHLTHYAMPCWWARTALGHKFVKWQVIGQQVSCICMYVYIQSLTSHSTLYRSFRRRGALSSDVHLPFSNGGPAT